MKYYLWYDETENITIGMLLTYLKKYLGNHRDFRIKLQILQRNKLWNKT